MAPTKRRTLASTDTEGEATIGGLHVDGVLPPGLSGRLVGLGPGSAVDDSPVVQDGMAHAVYLHAGRAISYQTRWVLTDAVTTRLGQEPVPGPRNNGPDVVASNIVVFGGSTLALGEGSLAYELTEDLGTRRRVDLAGQGRGLVPFPKLAPVSGDLHVLAVDATGAPAHVVVSARAHTRTSRYLTDAPARIHDLAISRDSYVFAAHGFVGVAARSTDAGITWIATDLNTPSLISAHDVEDTLVVYAVTPALERWTLHAPSVTLSREILDSTPRAFARVHNQYTYDSPRFLWTTVGTDVDRHDLVMTSKVRHVFERGQPSDLVLVADTARPHDPDVGWLVGFVHHGGDEADVVVLDAADIAGPALATIALPRPIPHGLHITWIPSPSKVP